MTKPTNEAIYQELLKEWRFSKSVYGRQLKESKITQNRYDERMAIIKALVTEFEIRATGGNMLFQPFKFSTWLKAQGWKHEKMGGTHYFKLNGDQIKIYEQFRMKRFRFSIQRAGEDQESSMMGMPLPENELEALVLVGRSQDTIGIEASGLVASAGQ